MAKRILPGQFLKEDRGGDFITRELDLGETPYFKEVLLNSGGKLPIWTWWRDPSIFGA